eukprot:gnl/TRDRNA2_/TRDRNA2_155514_c0_seq3.p1 gnl/TRDRNA2_/TRDRNA2_155514_c0~~gnl/TRDRNA2_/TRDRNA2_155514_c0_seq3.p1  ORF type:complete len:267 (+),score=60.48 gnl/TRDRNA2_/TRDRNA2_155514_c0_seq3:60-803(+)
MSKAKIVFADAADKIPTAPVDGKITTVYWNICGLGQPIRYALELAGVEYVDVRVHWGPGEPGTAGYKKMYFDRMPALSEAMLFPNLPYFLDGEIALAQSNTIMRHIGRKFNLMGDPSQAHIVDLIFDQTADFDGQSTGLSYREGLPGLKKYCEQRLPEMLSHWARLLGDKKFMTGESVTVADLKVYETLRKLKLIEEQPEVGTKALASCPTLLQFLARVEELPAMKAYLASEQFMARPLNNEHAQFK